MLMNVQARANERTIDITDTGLSLSRNQSQSLENERRSQIYFLSTIGQLSFQTHKPSKPHSLPANFTTPVESCERLIRKIFFQKTKRKLQKNVFNVCQKKNLSKALYDLSSPLFNKTYDAFPRKTCFLICKFQMKRNNLSFKVKTYKWIKKNKIYRIQKNLIFLALLFQFFQLFQQR